MRRRASGGGAQLFSFLDAMICTVGALLVLLHAFAKHGQTQVAETAEAVATQTAGEEEDDREGLAWRIDQLKAARERTEAQLAEERLKLSHLEDHERRLRQQLEELKAAAAQLEHSDTATNYQRDRAQAELDAAKQQLTAAEEELKAARGAAREAAKYSVVPYEGPHATSRRPIYIECRVDSIVLQPEGVEMSPDDFVGYYGPGNPLASAVRSIREYHARQSPTGQLPAEPYPLLLVRPEGIQAYYAARGALDSWGSEFGYELIGADWELKFPERDARLAESLKQVLAEARSRQREYILSSPQLTKKRSRQMYHARSQGGFSAEGGQGTPGGTGSGGGWDTLGSSWSRRGGGYGGKGAGGGYGDGKGTGDDQTASGENGGTSGRFGSGTGGNGSGQYPPGGSLSGPGRGQGGFGGGQGGSPGEGEMADNGDGAGAGGEGADGSRYGQAGTQSGSQGTGRFGQPSQPGQAGQPGSLFAKAGQRNGQYGQEAGGQESNGSDGTSPGGSSKYGSAKGKFASNGPAGNGSPSDGDAAGGGSSGSSEGQVGASGPSGGSSGSSSSSSASMGSPPPFGATKSNQKSKSMAHSRGRDWGLPETGAGAVGATRPIRVECHNDRIVIIPDNKADPPKVIKLGPKTADSMDELVAGVWQHMKGWGMAGKGLYWKPQLMVDIKPGAADRYADMKSLLDSSGLDVAERQQRRAATPARQPVR